MVINTIRVDDQKFTQRLVKLECKKLQTVYHINCHNIYVKANTPPKGLLLKKSLETGFSCEKLDHDLSSILLKASLSILKLTKQSFEKKLHSIYKKLSNMYNIINTTTEAKNKYILDLVSNKLCTYNKHLSKKSTKKVKRDIPGFNGVVTVSKLAKSPYSFKMSHCSDIPSSTTRNDPLFVDMTNGLLEDLTLAEESILNYGFKFVITPDKVDVREEIAQIGIFAHKLKSQLKLTGDEAIDNHNKKRVNDAINDITRAILSESLEKILPKQNLSDGEKEALVKLSQRPNLVFKKADKGSQLVIMREEDYKHKIEQLLSDSTVYRKLEEDPSDDLLNKLTLFITDAYSKGQLSQQQMEKLIPKDPKPGKFDGLPKTHKDGCPIRPIVSQINTVTRNLSEFVESKLHPYVIKMVTYNKDTIDVINCINGINTGKELSKHASIMLLTMDIDSFYTNVKCDMAVEAISKILKENGHPRGEIAFMKSALKLIFESNNFTFEDQHYIQLVGMSMGSPCAPSVCSLTFYVYELAFLKLNPKCLIWKRHIDDIFITFAGTERQLCNMMKKFMNNSTFTFTSSTIRNSVDFLDVTISIDHKNHVLNTKVYRHPAKIPVYAHKKSCQSGNMKSSLIRSSCLRFKRICSSLNNYDKSVKELRGKLCFRGYSPKFVDKISKEVRKKDRDSLLQPRGNNSNNSNGKKFVPRLSLTFIPGVTDKIAKITRSHWSKVSDLFEFPLSFSYKNNITVESVLTKKCKFPVWLNYSFTDVNNKILDIGNFTNMKEKCSKRACKTCDVHLVVPSKDDRNISLGNIKVQLPTHLKNCESKNLVYILTCSVCKDKHYVGETLQQLGNRVYGHRCHTAVVNRHFGSADHSVDDMKVVVLHKVRDSSSTVYRRGIEYFYLMTINPELNIDLAPP